MAGDGQPYLPAGYVSDGYFADGYFGLEGAPAPALDETVAFSLEIVKGINPSALAVATANATSRKIMTTNATTLELL